MAVDNEIVKAIAETSDKIKEDKQRLLNIINAINSGISDDKVIDKLIDDIVKIEYEDENVSNAMEFLTIILLNMRTHKLNQKKGTIDELLRTLDYNLTILQNLESAVLLYVKENKQLALTNNTDNLKLNESNLKINKIKPGSSGKKWYEYLGPKSKVDSIMMWSMALLITLFILYKLDSTALMVVKNMFISLPVTTK